MTAKFLATASLAVALGACSFEPLLTRKIVDYNRIAEQSGNEVILLNLLRAKDQKPLHFTTLVTINPGITGSSQLNLSIPLSPIAYTTATIQPSAQIQSSNSGQVAIESTKEFFQVL